MSSQFVATGTLPVAAHRVSRGYDNNGPYVEYSWRGTKSFCEGIFNDVGAVFDSQDIDQDGGVYTVRRRLNQLDNGVAEVPQDEIRMNVKREERDILSNAAFDTLTTDEMRQIEESITNKTALDGSLEAKLALTNDGKPKTLYDLAFRGVKSYPVWQPIITRTLTASRAYQFTISYTNCGKIISPSFIESHLNLTFTWPFNLPADTDPESDPYGRHYGWLKNYPDYQISANRKAVLSQTFEYGFWPAATYGEPVTS